MYSDWQAEAKRCIAAYMSDLPPDASWRDRQKRLRSRAHLFHGHTSWGKKVWSKHCKAYLALHGKPQPPTPAHVFADDIIFPFREPEAEIPRTDLCGGELDA